MHIDLNAWTIGTYDSLPGLKTNRVRQIVQMVNRHILDRLQKVEYFTRSNRAVRPFKRIFQRNVPAPAQFGASDCGVWTCLFLEFLCTGQSICRTSDSSEEIADNYRKRMTAVFYNARVPESKPESKPKSKPDRRVTKISLKAAVDMDDVRIHYSVMAKDDSDYIEVVPGEAFIVFKDFWGRLLKLEGAGWYDGNIVGTWAAHLLVNRVNAPWTSVDLGFIDLLKRGGDMSEIFGSDGLLHPAWWDIDHVCIPFNIPDSRWLLFHVDLNRWTVATYDSSPSCHPEVEKAKQLIIHVLPNRLQDVEYYTKPNVHAVRRPFNHIIPSDVPHQCGGSDCGVWTCIFLEYLFTGQLIRGISDNSREFADNYRKKMTTFFYQAIVE